MCFLFTQTFYVVYLGAPGEVQYRRYVVFFAQQAQSLYLFTQTGQYELVILLLAYINAIFQPENINNTAEDNSHRIRNKPSIQALAIKLRKARSNCSFYKTTN